MPERRSQAARSQSARDGIVQAAMGVFALKGYAAASMDDICLAAGCSKGGLYHHFPAKARVLGAVVDKLAATGALVPPAAGSEATGATGRVLVEIWAEAARDEALRARLSAGYEAVMDTAATGGLEGLLRTGALIQLLTRGDAADPAALARQLGIARAA